MIITIIWYLYITNLQQYINFAHAVWDTMFYKTLSSFNNI